MIRLPLSQLGKWDHGQRDMTKSRERGEEKCQEGNWRLEKRERTNKMRRRLELRKSKPKMTKISKTITSLEKSKNRTG